MKSKSCSDAGRYVAPDTKSEPDAYLCDRACFITPLNNRLTNRETGQVWVPSH